MKLCPIIEIKINGVWTSTGKPKPKPFLFNENENVDSN